MGPSSTTRRRRAILGSYPRQIRYVPPPPPATRHEAGTGPVVTRHRGRVRLWTSKTGAPRFVLLTDEARDRLRAAHLRWHDQTGYRLACYRALGPSGLPHVLRHSAASHLHSLGVGLDRVSLILGHRVRGALGHYLEPDWSGMLAEVGRLTIS